MVQPGLESIAADEISRDFAGDVKRTATGLVVFRLKETDATILRLRTTEDVFLLAWGTDQLSYRAKDLDQIERWTARDVKWDELLRIHHAIRPKPKGRPTYRLVTQMTGTHGYRRIDAGQALARGLRGKLPPNWPHADENAALEIWLTIHGASAYCGVRLSDRTMRHRTYKQEHIAASLRPTIAAAMARLARLKPHQVVVDPMCGAGTILAETMRMTPGGPNPPVWLGGDIDHAALRAAVRNLRAQGSARLSRWDATALPLADASVDRIISNPPFGKQMCSPELVGGLYHRMIGEYDRVLRPGGIAVLLVADYGLLADACKSRDWKSLEKHRARVLGQNATIGCWHK
jgi:23S rRNA G2445 N2-methylase RlmL